MRRATNPPEELETAGEFQSSLPMRRATKVFFQTDSKTQMISILAPRAGSDVGCKVNAVTDWVFQSSLPVPEATKMGERIR